MNFNTVAPYLPQPVVALKRVWDKRSNPDPSTKRTLLETALAVAGYFLTMNCSGYLGLNSLQAAALTTLVEPNIPRYAIGGHCVYQGVMGAIVAYRANNMASFGKNLALAFLGYFGTTRLIAELVREKIYNRL